MTTRAKVLVAALVLLGSVVAGILAVNLTRLSPWPLIWAGAAAAAAPFLVMALRIRRIDPFEPIYLFSFTYAVLFVVRPAIDLLSPGGVPSIVGLTAGPTMDLALLFCLIGLLSFYVGYYAKVGLWAGRAVPLPSAEPSPRLLRTGLLMTVIAGGAAYSAFLLGGGGLSALHTLLAGRSAEDASLAEASSGYLYTGPLWVTGPAILLLAYTPRWASVRGAIGLGLLVVSEVVNAANGTRSWVLLVAGAVVVTWYARRGRRPSAPLIVTGAIVVFLVGVAAPAGYRNVQGRSGSFGDYVAEAFTNPGAAATQFFQDGDTGEFDDFAIELQFVPNLVPYAYGQTYLDDAADPVPRVLWSGKPVLGDTQLMADIWPSLAAVNVGLSFSMFGEPYLNFGILGIVMLCLLMGAAWRGLYEWFKRAPTNPSVIAVFAISWPFLLLYLHGSVGGSYARQAIFLVPAVAVIVAAEVIARRRASKRLPVTRPELV